MPRSRKIAIWTAVFLACAGAGAFVASRTDPFPPGVQDPGARPTDSGSPSEGPAPPSMVEVVVEAATRHELHVGGACTSDWTITLDLVVKGDASAQGSGTARLGEGASCSFSTAQVQARAIPVTAQGHVEEGTLLLAMTAGTAITPAGSSDLGGLVATLARVRLAVPVDGPQDSVKTERPDGDLGRYVASYRASARCLDHC